MECKHLFFFSKKQYTEQPITKEREIILKTKKQKINNYPERNWEELQMQEVYTK